MNRTIKISLLAAAILLMNTSAFASSKSASMTVTANIISVCNVSVMPLNFGNYDPLGTNRTVPLSGSTVVTAQCVNELPATISLDEGLYKATGSSLSVPLRRMQCDDADGEYLNYTLYQDSAKTTAWGSGSGAMAYTGSGIADTFTIFASIPPGQSTEVGGFTDTVTVTLSY